MDVKVLLKNGQFITHEDVVKVTVVGCELVIHVDFGSENLAKEYVELFNVERLEVT